MVVKSLRWRTRGFFRLLDYIDKEERAEDETFRVMHNVRPCDTTKEIADQFFVNDAYRPNRATTTLYHEILAFKNGEDISLEVAEDLTREYLELRAPYALAYARPHFDRSHLHIHIAISGVEWQSSRTLRLNNKEFWRVRHELEAYQREHYPHIKSLVFSTEKEKREAELRAVREARELRDRAHGEKTIEPSPPDIFEEGSDVPHRLGAEREVEEQERRISEMEEIRRRRGDELGRGLE